MSRWLPVADQANSNQGQRASVLASRSAWEVL